MYIKPILNKLLVSSTSPNVLETNQSVLMDYVKLIL